LPGRTAGRTWSPGSPDTPNRSARRTVASIATYEEAERAVDRLADLDFPVQRVAVLGQDLHLVEQVTGKLDYPRAAWRGAVSGAVPGVLIDALQGGRRDFQSVTVMQPQRYEVVVDDELADQAARLLTTGV
jgi:hypothetical protein